MRTAWALMVMPTLAFEVHRIKDLRLHLAHGERSSQLQQAVGERGFPMVNVRDDREISYVSSVHEDDSILTGSAVGHISREVFHVKHFVLAILYV